MISPALPSFIAESGTEMESDISVSGKGKMQDQRKAVSGLLQSKQVKNSPAKVLKAGDDNQVKPEKP